MITEPPIIAHFCYGDFADRRGKPRPDSDSGSTKPIMLASSERTTMPDFCSNRDVTCLLPGGGGAVAGRTLLLPARPGLLGTTGVGGYDDDRHDRDHGYNGHDDGLHGRHHAAGQLDEWHRRLAHARKRIDPVARQPPGQIQPAQRCHWFLPRPARADGHERSAHGDRRSA